MKFKEKNENGKNNVSKPEKNVKKTKRKKGRRTFQFNNKKGYIT